MSKESYKRAIQDCRAAIAREREHKKKDNARIAASIKSTSSAEGKARLRKEKISVAARHDKAIEGYKKRIEMYQRSMKACK